MRAAVALAAFWRAAALGYVKLITYTREDEPGASLRAAGWQNEGAIRARSWNMPNRKREDKTEVVKRQRWAIEMVGKEPVKVTWPVDESQPGLFGAADAAVTRVGGKA